MEWHHIVEQKTASMLGIDSYKIYSKINTVALTKEQHRIISSYYSTKNFEKFGGLTPRAFMRLHNWSFEQQYEHGIETLKDILDIITKGGK